MTTKNYFINGDVKGDVLQGGTQQKITVTDSPGAIVNSTIIEQLPTSVSEKQFAQILEALREFLKSEQADNVDRAAFRAEIAEARELGHEKGWGKLRKYLATAADLVTLAAPIVLVIKTAIRAATGA